MWYFQEKARKEVLNVVVNEEITASEVANLKYLDMIIRETIRLFPVGPLLCRQLTKDLQLSENFDDYFLILIFFNLLRIIFPFLRYMHGA